jgi:hypothetical protein
MQHELKSWPEFFAPLFSGEKTAELRLNDRDYKAGDVLIFREWEPGPPQARWEGRYTGRECYRVVSHVLQGLGTVGVIEPLRGLNMRYCILSLKEIEGAMRAV